MPNPVVFMVATGDGGYGLQKACSRSNEKVIRSGLLENDFHISEMRLWMLRPISVLRLYTPSSVRRGKVEKTATCAI